MVKEIYHILKCEKMVGGKTFKKLSSDTAHLKNIKIKQYS